MGYAVYGVRETEEEGADPRASADDTERVD